MPITATDAMVATTNVVGKGSVMVVVDVSTVKETVALKSLFSAPMVVSPRTIRL